MVTSLQCGDGTLMGNVVTSLQCGDFMLTGNVVTCLQCGDGTLIGNVVTVSLLSVPGFQWADDAEPAAANGNGKLGTRFEMNVAGVRMINFIAKHPNQHRATKQADTRLTHDANMAQKKSDRVVVSFWGKCAVAVMSSADDADIDDLQVIACLIQWCSCVGPVTLCDSMVRVCACV